MVKKIKAVLALTLTALICSMLVYLVYRGIN